MPFTLIKGTFHPEKGIPDGDSVRFEPDDLDLMRSTGEVDVKADDTVQLRYEGIDAVEKNAKTNHARESVRANMTLLGADPDHPAPTRGYILTRMPDANGRPVSFVYAGEPAEEDGASIVLKTMRLKASVNYRLVRGGIAYPLFYETLFKELRDVLDVAYEQALSARIGIIKEDKSNAWVRYSGGDNAGLAKLPPIFPKLFRRLDEWNQPTLLGFREAIEKKEKERVHTLSDDRFLGFEDVIDVNPAGDRFRLLYRPDDMVFRPK